MKTGKLVKCIVAMMLLCTNFMPVMAQKNIDKVMKELEKRTDVSINSVTKRDPKTRKVVSMVKTYSVKDERTSFVKAFEMDEEDAITAIKDLPKGRTDLKGAKLTFIFSSAENEMRTYTLEVNKMGVVTLTVIIKQVKDGRDVSWWDADIIRRDPEIRRQLRRFMARQQKALQGDELGCVVTGK